MCRFRCGQPCGCAAYRGLCCGAAAVSCGRAALLDGKAAVELLGYAPAPELGGVLVYLSVENLSAASLPVDTSYLQSRGLRTREQLYSMGTGVTAACNGQSVPCGSFAAPLYNENAADASVFTLNLAAGRGALLHCFCAVPEDWQTLALTWHPDFAAGRSAIFTVRRDADEAALGPCPHPAEVAAWWICNSIPKEHCTNCVQWLFFCSKCRLPLRPLP